MARMHSDEVDIDDDLVRELVRVQLPEWAGLPVRRLVSGGSTNEIFRVGTTFDGAVCHGHPLGRVRERTAADRTPRTMPTIRIPLQHRNAIGRPTTPISAPNIG